MLHAHHRFDAPEALELRLTSSSLSAANSSITASNSMEGRSVVHCRSEDGDGGCRVDNIPHLMSEASSDEEFPDDDVYFDQGRATRSSSNNKADRFQAMLRQQRQQVNYLNDSNASVIFEEDQFSARGGAPAKRDSPFRSIVSKVSRSSSSSTSRDSESSTPVMMMIDLDDDDDDADDLPTVLSDSNLGTKIFTSKMLAAGPLAVPEPRHVAKKLPLPSQPPPPPATAQPHRTNANNSSHHRSNSSFSSTSSQSSFRSILRNGGAGKTGADGGGSEQQRTPLVPRSANNRRETTTIQRNATATPHRPRVVLDKENPQRELGTSKARGCQSERKHRGRSVEKKARAKSRRSVSYSSSTKGPLGERGKNRREGNSNTEEGGKVHRRTVSFPSEGLVQVQKPSCHRDNSRSPVQSTLGRRDDPAFVPILDTTRVKKAFPSHVRNGTDISPRTADFLANDSPAVIAMCQAQERERHHGGERPRLPELANGRVATARSVDGTDAKEVPSPAAISERGTFPPPTLKLALKPKANAGGAVHFSNSNVPSDGSDHDSVHRVPFSGDNSLGSTSSESSAEVNRRAEPKRRFFSFSSSDRKGKVSFRRKLRLSTVGLLSPVDEVGEGSTTCELTPTPLYEPVPSADATEEAAKGTDLARVPTSTSSKGSFAGSRDDSMVSPVSTELQKAAEIVWGEKNLSPSSAVSREGQSSVGVECSCVIL